MAKKTLEKLTKTIMNTAVSSGEWLKENAFNPRSIEWKSFDDPVTMYDRDIEYHFSDEVNKITKVNIIGEEYGHQKNGGDYSLIIDPIDGTKSFIRGEFQSSIAVALEKKDELVFGIVYDFMRNIMYVADQKEAYGLLVESGKKFPLNNSVGLKTTTLYVDDYVQKYTPKLEDVKNLTMRKAIGSVALNMAQIASGSMDGMISQPYTKTGKTDIAASYFLLKQAGFDMYDYKGNAFDWKDPGKGFITIRPEKRFVLDLLFQD